jgi:hypothetical protein
LTHACGKIFGLGGKMLQPKSWCYFMVLYWIWQDMWNVPSRTFFLQTVTSTLHGSKRTFFQGRYLYKYIGFSCLSPQSAGTPGRWVQSWANSVKNVIDRIE